EETVGQIGVVVEISVESRPAILKAVKQSRAVPDGAEKERRIRLRDLAIVIPTEGSCSFGERSKHQAIPIRENFLVAARPYSLFSSRVQFFLGGLDLGLHVWFQIITHDVENIGFFPISICGHIEVIRDELRVVAQDLLEFILTPDVKLSF